MARPKQYKNNCQHLCTTSSAMLSRHSSWPHERAWPWPGASSHFVSCRHQMPGGGLRQLRAPRSSPKIAGHAFAFHVAAGHARPLPAARATRNQHKANSARRSSTRAPLMLHGKMMAATPHQLLRRGRRQPRPIPPMPHRYRGDISRASPSVSFFEAATPRCCRFS